MSDLVLLGSAGLKTYQSALEVVGDNITNANTPGYSRRIARIEQAGSPSSGDPLASPRVTGNGVNVTGVRRAYDEFKANDARTASSDYSRLEVRQRWLTELQTNISSGAGSVGEGLTKFFNAAQDVAADPTASAPRIAFLDAAGTVAQRFRTTASGLDNTRDGIRAEIDQDVARTNEITRSLAALNKQLKRAQPNTAQAAALRDQRDGLLDELGTLMNVSMTESVDGTFEVRMGGSNGPVLVAPDGTSKLIGAQVSGNSTQIVVDPFGGNLPASSGGGALGGLIEAEKSVNDAHAQLDTLAGNFIAGINAQHVLGKDLAGATGGSLFAAVSLSATPSPANNGTASLALSVTGTVQAQGYKLWYAQGTGWSLSRADGTGTVTGAGPLDLDGVHVELGGAPKDGDNFTIAGGVSAAGMAVAITDPSKVAASSGDVGDNSNIQALINQRLPANGGYEQSYEKQVSSVANALADTKSLASATKALRDSTVTARDAATAVNLDDEAADLLRFQQAYQACSKIIQVAQTLFDSLIEIR